jgi:hypothetical protein
MSKEEDEREYTRFEPAFVDANLVLPDEEEIIGRVLDASRGGVAIAFPDKTDLPQRGTKVEISVKSADPHKRWKRLGETTVHRTWKAADSLYNGKGIALQFDSALSDQRTERILLSGSTQKARLAAQKNLANDDIDYLWSYRNLALDFQMKLFILTLTLGVALAGAYFTLNYHSVVAKLTHDPNISFWRTTLAALPGILAITCALMVSQKCISIQKIDSYIAILQLCSFKKQYPREYKGWITELWKFDHIFKTAICDSCEVTTKCASFKPGDIKALKSKKLFTNPPVNLYYVAMFTTFLSVLSISIIAVLIELFRFQWHISIKMAITLGITLFLLTAVGGLIHVFWKLRKGKFSFEYYRSCWLDLMNKCRYTI